MGAFTVEEPDRLDKVLAARPDVGSRRRAREAVETGKVTVDGEICREAGLPVEAGQTVEVHWNRPGTGKAVQKAKQELRDAGLSIVYEDEHLRVIDKPAGLVVHPAPGHWSGTLLNGLLALDPKALLLPRAGGDVVTECRLGCGARLPKRDRARHEKERCRLRPATCPNAGCGAVVAFERLRDHVANFCEDPYFVARRRMIRKYRAIRKYGRPWAATPDSDDGESGGDSEY